MKLSIISAGLNAAKYLEKCFDSIFNQTLDDFEFIFVNDGSTDDTDKIVQKYLNKYPDKFKYISRENKGLSASRNDGIDIASGEYIAFVDSDDYIDLDMYKKMYEKASSNDYDMIVCDVYLEYLDGRIKGIASSNLDYDIKTKEEVKKYMSIVYPSAWNKIYKRSLITKDNYFKVGAYFEDVEFIYRLLSKVNSIGCVKEPLYHYIQAVPGAITGKFDKRLYHHIDNFDDVIKYYKDRNIFLEYYHEIEYAYVRYSFATFIKGAKNYNKEDYKKAVEYAIEKVNLNFSNYKKNPYLKGGLKNIYLKNFNNFFSNLYYLLRRFIK